MSYRSPRSRSNGVVLCISFLSVPNNVAAFVGCALCCFGELLYKCTKKYIKVKQNVLFILIKSFLVYFLHSFDSLFNYHLVNFLRIKFVLPLTS